MDATDLEKTFLEMTKSKGYQKVSMNLRKETLDKIDELANIFNLNRTLVVESVLTEGIKDYLEFMNKGRKQILKKKETKNKDKLVEMGKKIEKFKKDYLI